VIFFQCRGPTAIWTAAALQIASCEFQVGGNGAHIV